MVEKAFVLAVVHTIGGEFRERRNVSTNLSQNVLQFGEAVVGAVEKAWKEGYDPGTPQYRIEVFIAKHDDGS